METVRSEVNVGFLVIELSYDGVQNLFFHGWLSVLLWRLKKTTALTVGGFVVLSCKILKYLAKKDL